MNIETKVAYDDILVPAFAAATKEDENETFKDPPTQETLIKAHENSGNINKEIDSSQVENHYKTLAEFNPAKYTTINTYAHLVTIKPDEEVCAEINKDKKNLEMALEAMKVLGNPAAKLVYDTVLNKALTENLKSKEQNADSYHPSQATLKEAQEAALKVVINSSVQKNSGLETNSITAPQTPSPSSKQPSPGRGF